MGYLVTPEEIQEILLVLIRQGFMVCASSDFKGGYMHEDEAGLCRPTLLQLLLEPLALCLVKAGLRNCSQDNKIALAHLKGVIGWSEDIPINITGTIVIKVVIANRNENRDCKVSLHLSEETPEETNFSFPNEVTAINGEGDRLVMADILQQGLKHRAISLVVPHDGEAIVVRIDNGNPRELSLVPVVDGHRRIGMPHCDPYE